MADSTYEIVHQVYATEAAAILINSKNMALAQDTRRLVFMDGATPRYYWDSTRLADQTTSYGTAIIGTPGITGVTPSGGSSGAASTLQAMLIGLAGTGNANFIQNGTGQQASSNFNISGAGVIGTTLTVSSDLSVAGNIIGTASPLVIRQNTAAASDTARTDITGGGGSGSDITRGAYLSLRGNNNGLAGLVQVVAGNVTGGQIILYTGNSVARLTINETGTAAFSGPVTAASTLGVTGATTLSSTLSVSGNTTFGAGAFITQGTSAASSQIAYLLQGAMSFTGTFQYGILAQPTFSVAATSEANVIEVGAVTASGVYTSTLVRSIYVLDALKGASSTITTLIGLDIANQTVGATNYAIRTGTGTVQFGDKLNVAGIITSTASGAGPTSGLQVVSATPSLGLNASGQAANTKQWDFAVGGVGTSLLVRAVNDANNASANALAITRSATTITDVSFGNATDNPTFNFLGTGVTLFGGEVRLSSGNTISVSASNVVDHKIKMVCNGVTYYIMAATSNA